MVLEKSKKNDTRLPSVATLPAPGVLAVVEQDRLAAFGDMSVENVVMPRLVIVQKMSPEVDDGSAKGGEFFIKGLGINMGTNPLEIIPVRRDVSKIRWKDKTGASGGILCRARDGHTGVGTPGGNCTVCPETHWNGEESPSCDHYENVFFILRGDPDMMPFLLSGNRTNLKAMKGLNTLLLQEFIKGRPIFTKSYLVGIVKKAQADRVWWNFTFRPGNDNKPLPVEDQKRAADVFSKFKNVRLEDSAEPVTDAREAESAPTI